MGPLLSVGIPAAASLLGGLFGNRSAANQASAQRAFEERMSSTSWQRGMADMRAAGINPMLAFSEGGASTPGGAMAGVPNPNVLGDAAGSAMQMAQLRSSLRLQAAQKYETEMRGFGNFTDAMVKQLNELPVEVRAGVKQEPAFAPLGFAGLRWQAAQNLMQANAGAASAAAAYNRAGIGQRSFWSDLWQRDVQPFTRKAGEGFRGVVDILGRIGGHPLSSARELYDFGRGFLTRPIGMGAAR